MPDYIELIVLSITALLAGFVDAIAGGGGVVTFPVFLFFGLPISEIVATNKLVSTFGTAMAARTFYKRGKVSVALVKLAIPWTILGSAAGATLVLMLPNEFLKPIVSTLIVAVALYCFFRSDFGSENRFNGLKENQRLLYCLGALLIAAYDGFFGPGTGIFFTFLFIRFLKFDFVQGAANTKVLNFFSNVVALIYFAIRGHVRYDLGVCMAIANIAGGYLGAHTAIAKGSTFIKWIFILMAGLTVIKLVLG